MCKIISSLGSRGAARDQGANRIKRWFTGMFVDLEMRKGTKARAADDIEILGKLLGRIDFSPKRHREHRPFQINRFLKV